MRPRVIAIQQPTSRGGSKPAFDFGPAGEFGEVEVLLPNGRDILTPDIFRRMIKEGLDGFDPERDYIIPTGDYSVLLFVGMILGQKYKSIQMLRWIPGARAYQPLLINLT